MPPFCFKQAEGIRKPRNNKLINLGMGGVHITADDDIFAALYHSHLIPEACFIEVHLVAEALSGCFAIREINIV